MNIILLSGGSGKRLWPLSNDTRSKQFLKLLKNEQGDLESMVQRVHGQIHSAGIEANIVIATGATQVDSIQNQLGKGVNIVLEPERRDTFPAIALSSAYLALEKQVDPEEVVLVLPVDPYADIQYFHTLLEMEEAVNSGAADLVLMGIKPIYPSEKYGYIVPVKGEAAQLNRNGMEILIYPVERFTEKPSEAAAKELIEEGAVWNGGVFAFKLKYLMDIVNHYIDLSKEKISSFTDLRDHYNIFKKISFDFEVVEKANSIAMIPYVGFWKDLGTWNTLSEEMGDECLGQVVLGEDTENTHVINELCIPIVALGVKDLIVAASPDGILVSDKNKSAQLKSYVDGISDRPMYEERLWGDYKALDYTSYEDGTKSLTKHLTIKAGQGIDYRAHSVRDEVWIIVDGTGKMVLDGEIRRIKRGDSLNIARGQKHAIRADMSSDIHCIEVQFGSELSMDDITKYSWEW
jgi:mannose-1-phosphate guanylyltransferase